MTTLNGIDVLAADPASAPISLRKRNVGIVTNPTGVTRDLRSTVDVLYALHDVRVKALFGPEHGVRGDIQDAIAIENEVDTQTGLPVYSLYGAHKKPTREMLHDIDLLIYDIQDIGCRYYTYAYSLSYVMEAAVACDIEVLVLDRPNPLTGVRLEGCLLDSSLSSFIGRYPVLIQHGMTIGEFARFINAEFNMGCALSVQPMRGWRRDMWFDETNLPWVTPSPNLPILDTNIVYPGTCLFEGTNVSEGRGTTHPFEWLGAPWVNAQAWAETLNALRLPGVRFRPVYFEPTYGKYVGKFCRGVQIHVTDRQLFQSVITGLHLVETCRHLHPQFEFLPTSWEGAQPHFDLLIGTADIRTALLHGDSIEHMTRTWADQISAFDAIRGAYLLY